MRSKSFIDCLQRLFYYFHFVRNRKPTNLRVISDLILNALLLFDRALFYAFEQGKQRTVFFADQISDCLSRVAVIPDLACSNYPTSQSFISWHPSSAQNESQEDASDSLLDIQLANSFLSGLAQSLLLLLTRLTISFLKARNYSICNHVHVMAAMTALDN